MHPSMKLLSTLLPLLLLLGTEATPPFPQPTAFIADRVNLQNLSSLTFTADRETTAGRKKAHAALVCTGGIARAAKGFYPSRVDCYNVGTNGAGGSAGIKPPTSARWKCMAKLDRSVRISQFAITCEGYSSPDDGFILRGSCWIGFRLEYVTGEGERGLMDAAGLAGQNPARAWGYAAILWAVMVCGAGLYTLLIAYRYCAVHRGGYVEIER